MDKMLKFTCLSDISWWTIQLNAHLKYRSEVEEEAAGVAQPHAI